MENGGVSGLGENGVKRRRYHITVEDEEEEEEEILTRKQRRSDEDGEEDENGSNPDEDGEENNEEEEIDGEDLAETWHQYVNQSCSDELCSLSSSEITQQSLNWIDMIQRI